MTKSMHKSPARLITFALAIMLAIAGASIFTHGEAWADAPGKPKITSVGSPSPGKLTIKTNAVKGAKGYQYVASTTKQFDKPARHDMESLTSTKTSASLADLKQGKTYYVKVRAYAKKGSYGKWSAVKSVKVKAKKTISESELSSSKAEAAKYKEQAASAAKEAENYKAKLKAEHEKTASLDKEKASLTSELANEKAKSEQLSQELDAANAEIQRLQSALEDAEAAALPIRITYELDGGTLPDIAKNTLSKIDSPYTLPAPSKQSCDFLGWYDSEGNRITAVSHENKNVTVTARWKPMELFFAYVDAGKRSTTTTEWNDATESYDGIKLYELYIGKGEDAPAVGEEYEGGTVVDVSGQSKNAAYPLGSVKLLTRADFNSLDLRNKMRDCSEVDLSMADVSNFSDAGGVFHICSSLVSVDISGWDMSGCTLLNGLFAGCKSLETVKANNVVLPSDCRDFFSNCTKLKAITGIAEWDTTNVKTMYGMFAHCKSLESLDISKWNTVKCADMTYMFNECSMIESINVSGISTKNVTSMGSMFSCCEKLESLDLSSWSTSNVTDMSGMLAGAGLKSLKTGPGWTYDSITDASLKPRFNTAMYDESGALYSDTRQARIPEGEHSYTAESPESPSALTTSSID